MLNCGPVERRATTQSFSDIKSFQENSFLATRNIIYWFSRISSGKMDKRKLSWVSHRRGRMTPTRVHVRWRKSKFRGVFSSNFSILKHQIIDFFFFPPHTTSTFTTVQLYEPLYHNKALWSNWTIRCGRKGSSRFTAVHTAYDSSSVPRYLHATINSRKR